MEGIVTVPVTIEVPKEAKEVADFVLQIIRAAKEGDDAIKIVTDALPAAMTAVQGIEQVPAELKGEYLSEFAAYLVNEIGTTLGR